MTAAITPWDQLRTRLQDRFDMAREVLDEAGHEGVAVLVPVEEVLIWMDEIEAENDSSKEGTKPVRLWWCTVHENQAIQMSNGTGQCYWHLRHECEVVQCLIPEKS